MHDPAIILPSVNTSKRNKYIGYLKDTNKKKRMLKAALFIIGKTRNNKNIHQQDSE